MKRKPSLDALALFDLVARYGGFSRAEQASGTPKATLSRQVRALEEQLGLRLIHRDSRAFALSEEGRLLHTRTSALLAEISESVDVLGHERAPARGLLRVSCPMMFGLMHMGRLASEFAQAFPDIQLEVTVEDREVDLVEEGYDVVVRVNPRHDTQLVGRCIFRDVQHLVAPRGMPKPQDETASVPSVTRSAAYEEKTVTVLLSKVEYTYRLRNALKVPSPLLVRDAVLAGGFAAILPFELVRPYLGDGSLVDWGRLPGKPVELWALHASRRLSSIRVRTFLDFLSEKAAQIPQSLVIDGN